MRKHCEHSGRVAAGSEGGPRGQAASPGPALRLPACVRVAVFTFFPAAARLSKDPQIHKVGTGPPEQVVQRQGVFFEPGF